jgi:hypothetical protein
MTDRAHTGHFYIFIFHPTCQQFFTISFPQIHLVFSRLLSQTNDRLITGK